MDLVSFSGSKKKGKLNKKPVFNKYQLKYCIVKKHQLFQDVK
jgi:hypothetical protein